MPTQTLKSIQQLFDGDVNANVPVAGWKSVMVMPFSRTHASDTNQNTFRTSFRTFEWTPGGDLVLNARFIMPNDRLNLTDVYYKFHFAPDDAGSGDVVLSISVTGANIGADFPAASGGSQTIAVDTQYRHYEAVFGPFGSNLNIGGAHFLRFDRDGSDANDTYPNTIGLVGLEAWYQVDRIATPNYLPPYYS